MRCRPEFITGQRKHADHTTFAAYVRNLTPTALSLSVPFGTLDQAPQMTPAAQAALRARNRKRYTTAPVPAAAANVTTPVASSGHRIADDNEKNWSSGTRTP
jgi:hypothetical protein